MILEIRIEAQVHLEVQDKQEYAKVNNYGSFYY